MKYAIVNETPITLSHCEVGIGELLSALERTNAKFDMLHQRTRAMSLDIFSVMDFRVMSGIMGETYARELAVLSGKFRQNPNIDGYPDLLQISTPELRDFYDNCKPADFIAYKYGGIEVKNTFGTKKSGTTLLKGDSRIGCVNPKLDWKAHHRQTNNLIALLSDYVQGVPVVVGLFYSDQLTEEDWNAKQDPKPGSAMTSFSAVSRSGFSKLRAGLRICIDDQRYLNFMLR